MILEEIAKEKAKQKPGTYVGVRFTKESLDKIRKFTKELGISSPVKRSETHATLVYSRKNVPNAKDMINEDVNETTAPNGEFHIWGDDNNCLVMLIDSDYLQDRFQTFKEAGAEWDFPNYEPHITLTYSADEDIKKQLKDLKWTLGDLVIESEYHEDLDTEWTDDK